MKIRRRIQNEWNGYFGPLPRPRSWGFIVGCYNSGTTLLHDLIARHPSVGRMPFEGHYYTNQLLRPADIGLPRLWALSPERFRMRATDGNHINVRRLKRQWGARYNNSSLPVLLEKTPTNAARMQWLNAHFEGARFIGIVRSGYAVAEGIRRKAGHDIADAARQWRVSNEIMLEDAASLSHFRLLRYEDLTSRPRDIISDLLDFLDLDRGSYPSLDALNLNIHNSGIETVANQNTRSVAALSDSDRQVITTEAGELLRHFGYLDRDNILGGNTE